MSTIIHAILRYFSPPRRENIEPPPGSTANAREKGVKTLKRPIDKDLQKISFEEVRASALVHLTGSGAEALDQEGRRQAPNTNPHS